jgi:hypothetical protein
MVRLDHSFVAKKLISLLVFIQIHISPKFNNHGFSPQIFYVQWIENVNYTVLFLVAISDQPNNIGID